MSHLIEYATNPHNAKEQSGLPTIAPLTSPRVCAGLGLSSTIPKTFLQKFSVA